MKIVGSVLIVLGILIVLGTAGSSDLGLITLGEMVTRALIGLSAIGAGTVLVRTANAIERNNK